MSIAFPHVRFTAVTIRIHALKSRHIGMLRCMFGAQCTGLHVLHERWVVLDQPPPAGCSTNSLGLGNLSSSWLARNFPIWRMQTNSSLVYNNRVFRVPDVIYRWPRSWGCRRHPPFSSIWWRKVWSSKIFAFSSAWPVSPTDVTRLNKLISNLS